MLFLAPIIINYAIDKELYSYGKYAFREAIKQVRAETGLNVRVGKKVALRDPLRIFDSPKSTKTMYIYRSWFAPSGAAEVCGNVGYAYINFTWVGSVDLIHHEILHELGADHAKGFYSAVTDGVMEDIKECLK